MFSLLKNVIFRFGFIRFSFQFIQIFVFTRFLLRFVGFFFVVDLVFRIACDFHAFHCSIPCVLQLISNFSCIVSFSG